MYQHDLSDKGIAERLRNVVEDCVNTVGVDLNTASSDLLRYISGLTDANVREIIARRSGGGTAEDTGVKGKKTAKQTGSGRFNALDELKGVKGVGPKTFRNCAGFLRVYNGAEPLDVTNIHPEDYPVARAMLELHRSGQLGSRSAEQNIREEQVSKKQKTHAVIGGEIITPGAWAQFSSTAAAGDGIAKVSKAALTLLRSKTTVELEQIWAWLQEAGLVPSPDGTLPAGPYVSIPKLLRSVPADFHTKIDVGSVVLGVIRNVTTFGAFVDLGGVEIGRKSDEGNGGKGKSASGKSCDGLLHSSKYKSYLQRSGRSVGDLSKEIYVGREVRVKIESIGEAEAGKGGHHEKRRIGLDLVELL
jgi:predicted RNA-binding protein with RPS1 domain